MKRFQAFVASLSVGQNKKQVQTKKTGRCFSKKDVKNGKEYVKGSDLLVSPSTDAINCTPDTHMHQSSYANFVTQKDPRVVFVSLYKLSQQWCDIPPHILMNSIVIVNGCRQQMFPETIEDTRLSVEWPLSKLDFTEHFREVIRCKDAQGLVVWMSGGDERETELKCNASDVASVVMNESAVNNTKQIALQWELISEQLRSIIDPFTNRLCNALLLCKEWWQQRDLTDLYYCDTANSVCNELSQCKGNFKALMELFKQSQPTLIPMIAFDEQKYEIEIVRIKTQYNAVESNSLFADNTEICFSVADVIITDINCDESLSESDELGFKYSQFFDIADTDGYVWFDYDLYVNS